MNVLITGGAGFIGSHLADKLLEDGHRGIVIDNLSTGRHRNIEHSMQTRSSVYGDGTQTRCFCFVGHVVEARVDLMNSPKATGTVFNIGGSEEISMSASGKGLELMPSTISNR